MSISNKDYLNKLIAKAKKSWEGVDVESYMSDLRDDTDKEDAEKEQKALENLKKAIKKRLSRHLSAPAPLDSIAPYWDEERKGVVIPLIGKVLHAKCLGESDWEEAKKLAKEAGGELFSKKEGYILAYYKDEINELLEAHGGDNLEGWNWCSSENSAKPAWYVYFNDGNIGRANKFCTGYVRAVSAF